MGFKTFMLISFTYSVNYAFLWLATFQRTPKENQLCIRITTKRSMRGMKKHGSSRINILGKYGIFGGLLSAPLSVIAMAIVFEKGTETMVLLAVLSSDDLHNPFSYDDPTETVLKKTL